MKLNSVGQSSEEKEIRKLIADLSSKDDRARARARISLEEAGEDAIVPLVEALSNPDKWLRREVAGVLARIREPAAAPELIIAFKSKDPDVRWLAAEGLIALGREGVELLLKALAKDAESVWLREGAHHVLKDLQKGKVHEGEGNYITLFALDEEEKEALKPVIKALEDLDSSVTVPPTSHLALVELQKIKKLS